MDCSLFGKIHILEPIKVCDVIVGYQCNICHRGNFIDCIVNSKQKMGEFGYYMWRQGMELKPYHMGSL